AREIVTVEAFGAKTCDHAPAVGCRCAVGLAPLEMALKLRYPVKSRSLPKDLAVVFVHAINLPGVRREVIDRSDVSIVAGPHLGIGLAANCGRDEDAIAPDDRARMTQAGDRRLPADVDAFGCVPGSWRLLPVGDAGRVRPTERRPVHR